MISMTMLYGTSQKNCPNCRSKWLTIELTDLNHRKNNNVWCHNCKGHGHLANECPTPKGVCTKCIFYGRNHAVQECCNLKQKFVNQININQSCPWQQERNGPGLVQTKMNQGKFDLLQMQRAWALCQQLSKS